MMKADKAEKLCSRVLWKARMFVEQPVLSYITDLSLKVILGSGRLGCLISAASLSTLS